MTNYADCYHQGVRVPSLEPAMEELGAALGLTWCEPQKRDQAVWIPDRGQMTIPLRFTYSAEGPQHVELLEGAPGSIWDGRDAPGLHHVGLWSEDVVRDTEAYVARGWTVLLGQRPPEDGYGAYAYVQPPDSAMLVELVTAAAQPRFEQWWAGGRL